MGVPQVPIFHKVDELTMGKFTVGIFIEAGDPNTPFILDNGIETTKDEFQGLYFRSIVADDDHKRAIAAQADQMRHNQILPVSEEFGNLKHQLEKTQTNNTNDHR